MNSANTIKATGLHVRYETERGIVHALDCPEFSAVSGTSVAIMGASGCGKSTLLGLLAGLAIPTEGSVIIGDTEISSLSESARVAFRKQNIGMVYQADNLLPFLTVAENLHLQLALCDDIENAEVKINDLLNKLGLNDLGERLPDQLSGGQRQRVAIARAIIHPPAIILADEPTESLDDTNASNVLELLFEVHKRLGATLVVVTHDPVIASKLERTVTFHNTQTDTDDF